MPFQEGICSTENLNHTRKYEFVLSEPTRVQWPDWQVYRACWEFSPPDHAPVIKSAPFKLCPSDDNRALVCLVITELVSQYLESSHGPEENRDYPASKMLPRSPGLTARTLSLQELPQAFIWGPLAFISCKFQQLKGSTGRGCQTALVSLSTTLFTGG